MRLEQPSPPISIVISTRDRASSLRRCLESCIRLDYPSYEIIVVDNAPSTPATRQVVETLRHTLPVHYVLEQRPGLSIAHNTGALIAKGELLAFTDDDVEVDPDWLKQLVTGFQVAPGVGCVTGAILPAELVTPAQVLLEEFGGYYRGSDVLLFDLADNRPKGLPLFPYSGGIYGGGANMAFTRRALGAIGGFDPALGAGTKAMGGDDLAAFFDVIASGFTLVYQPSAVVRHYHRREYAGMRSTAFGYGVGLTAYLTRLVFDDPGRLREMIPKLPTAARHILSPASVKNRKKGAAYPRELTKLERAGMLKGPAAFIASRFAARHLRSQRWNSFDDAWQMRGSDIRRHAEVGS